MSRNTVSPELHRNEALTCVVRTGFCTSYTEEIWPRMHRSGARGGAGGREAELWWSATTVGSPDDPFRGPSKMAGGGAI
jgi:hypothetical protein